jgi:hypothetical protein
MNAHRCHSFFARSLHSLLDSLSPPILFTFNRSVPRRCAQQNPLQCECWHDTPRTCRPKQLCSCQKRWPPPKRMVSSPSIQQNYIDRSMVSVRSMRVGGIWRVRFKLEETYDQHTPKRCVSIDDPSIFHPYPTHLFLESSSGTHWNMGGSCQISLTQMLHGALPYLPTFALVQNHPVMAWNQRDLVGHRGCSNTWEDFQQFSARRWPGPKDVLPKSTSNGWFHGGKWLLSRWKMVHVVNQEIIPKITINGRYKPCPKGRFIIGLPTSHQGLLTQLLCGTASLWSTDPTNLFATKIDGSQPSIPHKTHHNTHHKTHYLFG